MTEIGHVLLVMALCLEALVAPHPGPPAARWGGHQGSIGTKSGTPGLPKGKSSRAVEAYRLNVVRPRCLRRRLVGADRDAAMGFMVHDRSPTIAAARRGTSSAVPMLVAGRGTRRMTRRSGRIHRDLGLGMAARGGVNPCF